MRLYLRAALALSACAIPMFAENTAVLPFTSADGNPASVDWIGESIAETLRAAFTARGVLTLERNRTTEAYQRLHLRERTELTEASMLKVGEVLDAEQIVHGTFSFVPSASSGAATATTSK